MDQNDTMDAIRKFHKTPVSQLWKALDIQPFTSKKSMGPLPLNWDLCIRAFLGICLQRASLSLDKR